MTVSGSLAVVSVKLKIYQGKQLLACLACLACRQCYLDFKGYFSKIVYFQNCDQKKIFFRESVVFKYLARTYFRKFRRKSRKNRENEYTLIGIKRQIRCHS